MAVKKKKSKKKKKKTRQQLHVLPFVIDYQRQNGLRHEDYERYRRFCSRRLRRLRTSLKFPCGKKRFKKQSITRDLVTDERYLHIMLFTAERAWAYYVQLKEEAKTDSHKKFHMIGRLRRATLYAQELSEIVGNDGKLCDERTELETRAYAAWMQALCSREHQSWKDALENFGASKHIYERLGNVCGEVNKPLYAKKVEEIDAQIRYSSFMLGESGVDISTLLASGGAEMDMLKEKFARVVEDSDKSETDTLSSISWRGRVVPVQSQKLQLSILKIRSKEKALDQAKNFAAVMEAYDELFLEFGEAKSIIVDEIQAEKKSSSEADIGHLEFSYDYMEYTHLESTVTRTMRMIDDATAKFDADGGAGNPDEIVRFYDMMLQNLVDMEDINTLQDDHEFSKELAGRTCLYKALRCLYLAQAQLNVDSNKGAVALLERGATHARLSQSEFSECVEPMSKSNSALMKMFQEEVRRKRCLIQAKVFMKDMEAEKEVTSKAEAAARSGTLYENMDSYDLGARSVSKKPNLVQFPPAFVPTPCKPLFFDLASNYIDFPDVEKRAAPPKAERNQSGSWGLPTFGLWGN